MDWTTAKSLAWGTSPDATPGDLTGLDCWNNLDAGRTYTNYCNLLALKFDGWIPIGTVQHRSLECLSTLDIRPLPLTGKGALTFLFQGLILLNLL